MYYSQLTCLRTAQLFDAFFLIILLSSHVLWIYSPERTFPGNNVCSEDWPNPVHTSKLAGSGNPDMLFPGGRLTHNHKNSRPIARGWHARKYFDLKLDKSQFDSFALSTDCPWTFHVWIQKQSFTDEMPKYVLFMTICLWNDTVCSKHENSVGICGSKISSLCFTLSDPCHYQSGQLSLQISWKFSPPIDGNCGRATFKADNAI